MNLEFYFWFKYRYNNHCSYSFAQIFQACVYISCSRSLSTFEGTRGLHNLSKVVICKSRIFHSLTLSKRRVEMSLSVSGRQPQPALGTVLSWGALCRHPSSCEGNQLCKHSLALSQGGEETCQKGELGKIAGSPDSLKRT